jgi:hypothetical protein
MNASSKKNAVRQLVRAARPPRTGRLVGWMAAPDAQSSGLGTAVDGSKTVHAAGVYWPDHPAGPPPPLDKEVDASLRFRHTGSSSDNGNNNELIWDVVEDESGKVLRSYNESDIRFSLVYRARCVRYPRHRHQLL